MKQKCLGLIVNQSALKRFKKYYIDIDMSGKSFNRISVGLKHMINT
jgi:hypothetical protein